MNFVLYFVLAAAASALLTPVVRLIALRTGNVVTPRSDRWHNRPTPLLGGVAMFAAFIPVCLLVPGTLPDLAPLLACGALMFALGLVDDLRSLSPQVKFVGQIAITALLIATGTVIEIIPWPVVAYPLTFVWIVGLTNAFNLLDNMDGLSAGIAAISALILFGVSLGGGQMPVALGALVLAGVCVGFLFFNFNPARIFMGDCGSMFLGFMLASLAISGTWKHASGLFVTLLLPVVILSIPIFDTAFVTITRTLRGQPISQGGRDHISHRLVALGFSERKTVLILYALAAAFGLGMLLFKENSPLGLATVALLVLMGLFYFGIYLNYAGRTSGISSASPAGQPQQAHALLVSAQRFVEIFIDLCLVAAAYFAAYVIRFEAGMPQVQFDYFMQTLPVVIALKLGIFYLCGLYQTMWRHVGVRDFVNIVKAVCFSSLLVMAFVVMSGRFEFFARAVFIIDALLCLCLISGAHFSLRVLREYLEAEPVGSRRVVIIGAGDAGEMALREIRNNSALKYYVAGFLDDDPFKHRRKIHGVRVLGTIDDVGRVVESAGVDEALLAIPSLDAGRRGRIEALCRDYGIVCTDFKYPGSAARQ